MGSRPLQSFAVAALRGIGRVGGRAAASAVASVLKDADGVAVEARRRVNNALKTLDRIFDRDDRED